MDHFSLVLEAREGQPGVIRLTIERPDAYPVRPGDVVEIALNDELCADTPRPFHVRRTTARTIELVFFADFRADPLLCRYASLQPGDWLVLSDPFRPGQGAPCFGGWRRPSVRAWQPQAMQAPALKSGGEAG